MSQHYFSYVDTALRVIHINTYLKEDAEYVTNLSKTLDEIDTYQEMKVDLIEKVVLKQIQNKELYALLLHESHHYWQTLFYPFLFYLSWMEFTILMRYRNEMRLRKTAVDIPYDDVLMEGKNLNTLTYTAKKFKLIWNKTGLTVSFELSPDNYQDSDTFCLIDFLEDVTTLFQYKTTEKEPNAENYFKWIQNPKNKGYKRLYKFLLNKHGKEYAYYFLPILVQLAFSTTEPMGAFCDFVNISIYYGLDDEDENNFEILRACLKFIQ